MAMTFKKMRVEVSTALELYRTMLCIRRFEEKSAEMYGRAKIGGFLHLYIGEEAVAAGAIPILKPQDYIVTHYRDHGHAIARGLETKRLMAELFGKETGTSKGKGGSMHLFDSTKGFMGGYAIVGGMMPVGVGLAMASKYQKQKRVCLCIFGDGAVNQGEFHESFNLAALWDLPIIFLLENNGFGMGTRVERAHAGPEMARLADAFGIRSEQVDGMDVLAMREATSRAIEHTRSGKGPYFLEALTYRFRGHSMADPMQYRDKEEEQEWLRRDPLVQLRGRLSAENVGEDAFMTIEESVDQELELAVEFADQSKALSPNDLMEDIYRE